MSLAASPLPELGRKAFACPHCGAFASQKWFNGWANDTPETAPPSVPAADLFNSPDDLPAFKHSADQVRMKEMMVVWRDGMRSGAPFFEDRSVSLSPFAVPNLFFSKCFACSKIALWLADTLLVPAKLGTPPPHVDLPSSIVPDYQEARSIANASPRGAAALLRLAIQKLCVELGEPGKDLNKDIGSMVAKGLPVQIQQALDTVRVVGNESVHPGEMDLKDDRQTAEQLFGLVNMIVDERITRPKALAALYANLPTGKLAGIVKRDTPPL